MCDLHVNAKIAQKTTNIDMDFMEFQRWVSEESIYINRPMDPYGLCENEHTYVYFFDVLVNKN